MEYILKADHDHFQSIHPAVEKEWSLFTTGFSGRCIGDSWSSPEMKFLIDNEFDASLPLGDCPHLTSHVPVFSKKAMAVFEPLVKPYGEFLELVIEGQELYAFNVTKLVDALDMEKSDYVTFKDGRRMMYLRKQVLKGSMVRGLPIFKLTQLPLMFVYVNDDFVGIVKKNDLQGFLFIPISEYKFGT